MTMEEKESTLITEKKTDWKNQLDKISIYLAPVICFLLAFGFAFTPIWQLSFIAGIIGGLFFYEMKKGLLVGMIGVGLGWTLYLLIEILTSKVSLIIDQILAIFISNDNLSWLAYLILILLSLIIGILSGSLGSGIRRLIYLYTTEKEENVTN